MTISLKPRFIRVMNDIIQLKSEKCKTIRIKTKDSRIHYLQIEDYEEFIHNESETIKTTTPFLVSPERYESSVNPNDIKKIGYLPKDAPNDVINVKYVRF